GSSLFESAPMSTAGTGLQPVTFTIPGGVVLVPGQQYVLFATTSKDQGSIPDETTGSWAYTDGDDDYSGGSIVYSNNGTDFGALTTSPWTVDTFDGDFAFTATFAGQPTIPDQTETADSGQITVANFVNTGYPANPGSDFSVSIDWGDGGSSAVLDTTSG